MVRARVGTARERQTARYAGTPGRTNAEADGTLLEAVATPDAAEQKRLVQATQALKLAARGYHRVLHVARTIADLVGAEQLNCLHLAEALRFQRQPLVS